MQDRDGEGHRITTLDNGLRVLSWRKTGWRGAAVFLSIGVGSRYESKREAGLSHFVEHMLFKGTAKWPDAKRLNDAIGKLGGFIQGKVSRDVTDYMTYLAVTHLDFTLDVFSDVVLRSLFREADIENERRVLKEELRECRDDSERIAEDLLYEMLWPDQPLGRPVEGLPRTIGHFNRDDLLHYLNRHYRPHRSALAVVGDVAHETVVELASRHLDAWTAQPSPASLEPATEWKGTTVSGEIRKTEQARMALAFYGLPRTHADFAALEVMDSMLSYGTTGLLYEELRDRLGFVYDVGTRYTAFADTGSVEIHAGVAPSRLQEALAAILEQLNRLKSDDLAADLERTKLGLKETMLLGLDDPCAIADDLIEQELRLGRVLTFEEQIQRLEAITLADIQRLARQVFTPERLKLAVAGPRRNDDRLLNLIQATL